MTAPTLDELLPCPFCGAGETRIDEKYMPPTMQGSGSLISAEIVHWCIRIEGQPTRRNMCFVGRDRASAIAAWNTRAQSLALVDAAVVKDDLTTSQFELRYHAAMPGWCKIMGLKIKAIHKCEGGGFAVAQDQAEAIVASICKQSLQVGDAGQGWQDISTADVNAWGPIDGTNADHPSGSYVRLSITGKSDKTQRFKISRGAAEGLIAELQGCLDRYLPLPAASTVDVTTGDSYSCYLGPDGLTGSLEEMKAFQAVLDQSNHISVSTGVWKMVVKALNFYEEKTFYYPTAHYLKSLINFDEGEKARKALAAVRDIEGGA